MPNKAFTSISLGLETAENFKIWCKKRNYTHSDGIDELMGIKAELEKKGVA